MQEATLQSLYLQHNYLTDSGALADASLPPSVAVCLQYNCTLVPPPQSLCPPNVDMPASRPGYQCLKKFSEERKSLLGVVAAICSGAVGVNQIFNIQHCRALDVKIDAIISESEAARDAFKRRVEEAISESKAARDALKRRVEEAISESKATRDAFNMRVEVVQRRTDANIVAINAKIDAIGARLDALVEKK